VINGRAIAAQARVELALTLRRGESLLVAFAIPVGILVFFSEVAAITTDLSRPVDFLVPGVLALAVMSTAMVSLAIATGYERRYGVLKRLGSTPLSRGGLLAAKTVNVLAVECLQAVTIVVTGLALGWHATAGLLLAAAFLVLGTVAFAGIGLLLAGTLRAEATLAAANGAFLVLLFVGGMAYPLDDLPRLLEEIAKLLPAAALAESVRGAVSPDTAIPGWSVIVLALWAVGAPLLAARFFRWEE
jgi:ABC-2 type transport system permease protein